MKEFKGNIVLDIDGTTTYDKEPVGLKTASYLQYLYEEGWQISFATGRSYSFALKALKPLMFSYGVVTQNGAACFQDGVKIQTLYMKKDQTFKIMDPFAQQHEGLWLLESGIDNNDICYYPEKMTSEGKKFVDFRSSICPERWEPITSYDLVPVETFPLLKFYSHQKVIDELMKYLDPFDYQKVVVSNQFSGSNFDTIVLISDIKATKKNGILPLVDLSKPIIAAGDDLNDVPMLSLGSTKIIMETAPDFLKKQADIIARPAKDQGLIEALEKAIDLI